MFLTLLIAGYLHLTQGWTMQLQPAKPTVVAQLHLQAERGIQLQPAHVTIVKTWDY